MRGQALFKIISWTIILTSDSNWYICDDFSVPRKSKDNVVNKFGRSVIDLCCNFNVHM